MSFLFMNKYFVYFKNYYSQPPQSLNILFFHLFVADAKEQVLANLANFAYDPDNYSHFRELNIVDLFLGKMFFFLSILF